MGRHIVRAGGVLLAASLATALGVGTSTILGGAALADPSPQGSCAFIAPGSDSGWCPLYASGTAPSDSQANGEVAVSTDGTELTISTEDNGQGPHALGDAPAESEACIYPGGANREPRLMDIAKCGDVGGTLVTWQGTNTTTAPVPTALVGNDFTVWVEAHPDSNNGHGTPYHYEFGVPAKGSPLPVGTALGGLAVALLLGGGLMWRLRRRPSVQ